MTKTALLRFLRNHRWAIEATVAKDGQPQAAVIGFAVSPKLELVFDTSRRSRKAENLRRDRRVAMVIGWDEAQTVQIEGIASELTGAERTRLLRVYVAQFPDGKARAKDPDIVLYAVRPTWARYSDFRKMPAKIEEMKL